MKIPKCLNCRMKLGEKSGLALVNLGTGDIRRFCGDVCCNDYLYARRYK